VITINLPVYLYIISTKKKLSVCEKHGFLIILVTISLRPQNLLWLSYWS